MHCNSKKAVLKSDVLSWLFSKKGKNDNGFQIIRNYEEKREVLKSSGTTRNNSGTNHRKKKRVVGQETEIEFSE